VLSWIAAQGLPAQRPFVMACIWRRILQDSLRSFTLVTDPPTHVACMPGLAVLPCRLFKNPCYSIVRQYPCCDHYPSVSIFVLLCPPCMEEFKLLNAVSACLPCHCMTSPSCCAVCCSRPLLQPL